jgi:predicted transcriptional regulator
MMEELAIEDEFTNLAANSAQTKHQRMEPVGASSTLYNSHSLFSDTAVTNNTTTAVSSSSPSESGIFNDSMSRMHMLEQEHEQLSSSLMSLTTHFAQVQFRLKQVVAAADEDKDRLLRELEEFAFRGCPNMSNSVSMASAVQDQIIEEQRAKQKDLIEQLKAQLQDLEIYAYQVA